METPGLQIAAAARTWVGTRFAHQGRLKATATHKGGVDCLGLLIGVARELDLRDHRGNLLAELDNTDYGHYPDTAALRAVLVGVLTPVSIDTLAHGDVVLIKINGLPQHLGIVAGSSERNQQLTLIHAYAPARCVVEHALDEWWCKRIVEGFRLPTRYKALAALPVSGNCPVVMQDVD